MSGLYCIEVSKEFAEDSWVGHQRFEKDPERQDILDWIHSEDDNYDDNYGKFNYYKVAD